MLRSENLCLNINNSLNRRVPFDQLRSSQPLTLQEVPYLITIHLFKVMCVRRTVCEDLTRRSAVKSRIAVLYLCPKIYIQERGRIIYFMSTRDCPLLCASVCGCDWFTIVHTRFLLAWVRQCVWRVNTQVSVFMPALYSQLKIFLEFVFTQSTRPGYIFQNTQRFFLSDFTDK